MMKFHTELKNEKPYFRALIYIFMLGYLLSIPQIVGQDVDQNKFIEIEGLVLMGDSKKPLEYASVSVTGTNISTITNLDGKFRIKIPSNVIDQNLLINYLGYQNKVLKISDLTPDGNVIRMYESTENLPEINVITGDPVKIMAKVLENRKKNSFDDHTILTAFYRESIKKGRSYASLSEAVVEVYNKPIRSSGNDHVKLQKVRKSSNYKKLDTLVIKLQGGPYNNLNMDMIKNNDLFFNEDLFEHYKFDFDKAINTNNRVTYIINFEPNGYNSVPLFYGQLFVDAETYALSKAFFKLNLDDQKSASKYFVRKKPNKAEVIPTRAVFRVDYTLNNGKWHHVYSKIDLIFKIDWKKRIFNSNYNITIEMAITDWRTNDGEINLRGKDRLSSTAIINDEAKGFSDPDFWGEHNVIEPDKSIENAIRKINKQS